MLPLCARVNLWVMAIKEYSTFPKASVFLEPHHQIVSCRIQATHCVSVTQLQRCSRCILQLQPTGSRDTCWEGVLPLCRDAVSVFYSSSQLGHGTLVGGRGSYPSAEMQAVYSTAPANWNISYHCLQVLTWSNFTIINLCINTVGNKM